MDFDPRAAADAAEIIAAVARTDVEVVDRDLQLVAATGAARDRLGLRVHADLYLRCFRSGLPAVGATGSRAAPGVVLACPIHREGQVLGAVGLVASDSEQAARVLASHQEMTSFLVFMSELLGVPRTPPAAPPPEAEDRTRIILDALPEGLVAVDPQGNVVHCNGAALRLLRLEFDPTGQPLGACYPPLARIARHLAGRTIPEEESLFHRQGHSLHLVHSVRPIRHLGEVVGSLITLRDIAGVRDLVNRLGAPDALVTFDDIMGRTPLIAEVRERARRVAAGDATVLILGESGTGKELFARAIHAASPRRDGPFIAVNCGALPETLIESELFGYAEGAFTGARRGGKPGKFELASGGTLFLDEIGDLPLHLQMKLLRVVEERAVDRLGGTRPIPVNIRLIAATHRDLEAMVARGEFREDLYFRLAVIPLHVPPLRDRPGDIPDLARAFLRRIGQARGKDVQGFHPDAMRLLVGYRWPGNVRELQNAVDYAVSIADGPHVLPEHLPPRVRTPAGEDEQALPTLAQAEHRLIQEALRRYGSNGAGKRQAARALGINLATLYRKIKQQGIG
jgi:transcriptional regulator with PAS, ATPase and Fis domain